MVADVTSVITTLLTGPKIDRALADKIIFAAGEDGIVSAAEKTAITSAVTDHKDQFTPGALAKLKQFVDKPFSLPSTAGAFAMEKFLAKNDSAGIDTPVLKRAETFVARPEPRAAITLRHFSFMTPAARTAALENEFSKTTVFSGDVINSMAIAVRSQLSEPLASRTVLDFVNKRLGQLDDSGYAALAELELTAADKVDAAMLDGLMTELTVARSADFARSLVLRTMRTHLPALRNDGPDALLRIAGDMRGHINSYQRVLTGHLKDAQLIDFNGDGVIDPSDIAFTKRADGTVDVQAIGTALCDRVQIEAAIVDACYDMSNHPHAFNIIKAQHFSPAFWVPQGGGTFTLKPGMRPSAAVRDICANPKAYGFECATAMVIVYYKAMLDLLGSDTFDKTCANLKIGPWEYEGVLASVYMITGDGQAPGNPNLIPGTYGYIRNWDVSDKAKEGGWQGENVIALGNGMYFGHPFGVDSGANIIKYLNTQRKAGSQRSASLTGAEGTITSGIMRFRAATPDLMPAPAH